MKTLQTQNEPVQINPVPVQPSTDAELLQEAAPELSEQDGHLLANLDALTEAVRYRKRAVRWLPVTGLVSVGSLVTLITKMTRYGVPSMIHPSSFDITMERSLVAVFIAACIAGLAQAFAGMDRPGKAAFKLVNASDPRITGPFIEALSSSETVNSIASSVLIRVLPELTIEDGEALTDAQREAMRAGLKSALSRWRIGRYNPTLATVLIETLGRIGSVDDLPLLESLERRRSASEDRQQFAASARAAMRQIAARKASQGGIEIPWVSQKLEENKRDHATALSDAAVQNLAQRVSAIAKLRKRSLLFTGAGALTGLGFAASRIYDFVNGHGTNQLITYGLAGSLGTIFLFATRGLYVQRNITQALTHTDDLRIVGPLLESAAGNEVSAAAAISVVTPLLGRFKASDGGLLNPEQRGYLHRAMSIHQANAEFVLAALYALQQLGAADSIPAVQKVISRFGGKNSHPEILAAAKDCLESMRLRATDEEQNRTLLRASSAAEIGGEALLRPATPAAEPVNELLRAAE